MSIPLFTPRRVALIGATDGSADPWSFNARLTRAVVGSALEQVLLVSRSATSIAGRPTVTSVLDSPSPIDVAVLAVPASGLTTVLVQCVEAGIPGCIVVTADVTRSARELMVELRDAGTMRIVGPNCIGFVDTLAGVRLFAGGSMPGPPTISRPVVAITQSGGFASSLIAAGEPAGIGFSHVFTTGEELDIGLEDCLEHALESLSPGAVVLFVETLRQPMRFRRLARRAAAGGVPLVLLRVGRTAMAREVAMAHTGALVGDWDGTTAALEADGVIACDTFEEILDVTLLATSTNTPLDGTVEVVTTSGAMGALAADLAAVAGATLVPAANTLAANLPALTDHPDVLRNPLDTSNSGGSVSTLRGLRSAMGKSEPNRALLFAHSGATYAEAVAEELVALLRLNAAGSVIACWPGVPAHRRGSFARGRRAPTTRRRPRVARDCAACRVGGPIGTGWPHWACRGRICPGPDACWATSGAAPCSRAGGCPSPGYVGPRRRQSQGSAAFERAVRREAGGRGEPQGRGRRGCARRGDLAPRLRRWWPASADAGYHGPIIVEERAEPGTEVLVDVRRSPFGDLLTVGWGGSDAEQVADVITVCIAAGPGRALVRLSLSRG
jgi:acyl-CoA synthetase (NDP forming)